MTYSSNIKLALLNIFLLITCLSSYAQEDIENLLTDVKLSLSLNEPISSYIEPIFYKISLENHSDSASYQIKTPFALQQLPELQFYDSKKKKWIKLKGSDISYRIKYSSSIHKGFTKIKKNDLKPKESISKDFVYLASKGNANSTNYLLNQYKKYRIRAVYYPFIGDKKNQIVSNELSLNLKPQNKEQAKAQKWLKTRAVPHLVYEYPILRDSWGLFKDGNKKMVEELNIIIEKYPKSKYATWAKVQLVKYLIYQANTQEMAKEEHFKKAHNLLKGIEIQESKVLQKYLKPLFYSILYRKMKNNLLTEREYLKERRKLDNLFRNKKEVPTDN